MDFTWITSGANKAAAKEAYESGEDIQLDWWDKLRGATEEDAQNAYNTRQQRDVNRSVGGALVSSGKSGALWGETLQQAQGRAALGLREQKRGDLTETRNYDATVRSDNQKPLMAQIAAQTKASSDQLQLSREQGNNQMEMMRLEFAQGNKDRLADRADARDARADDRMMQLEMYERADAKDEKNRRRESIQALVAGLTSLGAAFAV